MTIDETIRFFKNFKKAHGTWGVSNIDAVCDLAIEKLEELEVPRDHKSVSMLRWAQRQKGLAMRPHGDLVKRSQDFRNGIIAACQMFLHIYGGFPLPQRDLSAEEWYDYV